MKPIPYVMLAGALFLPGIAAPQSKRGLTAKDVYARSIESVVYIEATTPKGTVMGAGFFYERGNVVATCYHVVEGTTKIVIWGTRGKRWVPVRMSFDKAGDTALLYLEKDSGRKPLRSGPTPSVGDPVFVIGHPLGVLTGSLTTGILSSHRMNRTLPLLQISAPISTGNSGGPVLDSRGRVLGMVSYFFKEGQNLNMAVDVQVLGWVARRRRFVAAGAFYAANGAPTAKVAESTREGDPRPSRPKPSETKPPPVGKTSKAAARRRVAVALLDYNNGVTAAFIRWRIAEADWSSGKHGVRRENFDEAYRKFVEAVSSRRYLDPILENATAADAPGVYRRALDAGTTFLRTARVQYEVELENASEVSGGRGIRQTDALAGMVHERLFEGFAHLTNVLTNSEWVEREDMADRASLVVKGCSFMFPLGAWVDPNSSYLARIRSADRESPLREGDVVVGVRLRGVPGWTEVNTWHDLWVFWLDRGDALPAQDWDLLVNRGTEELVVRLTVPPETGGIR